MKTTVDIPDSLLLRARRYARQSGTPLRALIAEGLRRVLEDRPTQDPYQLPDHSVGCAGGPNPLEGLTWPALRSRIYSEHGRAWRRT